MAKKKAKKKAVKKPSYETLQRTIRKLKKQTADKSAELHARAYDLFKEVHGSNGNIVALVNEIVADSQDQLWSQVRAKIVNYGGPI